MPVVTGTIQTGKFRPKKKLKIPNYLTLETTSGSPGYFWANSSGVLQFGTVEPTSSTYDSAGTSITSTTAATVALDNLASVAINADLDPGADGTIDLGDGTHEYKDLYIDGVAYIDDARLDIAQLGGATNYIDVAAGGVATMQGTATIDGVASGNLVDKSASETMTGAWTFSNASGILTNTITERTAGSGVTIDSLLIKDEEVYVLTDNKKVYFGDASTDSYIYFDGTHLTFYDTNLGTTATLTSMAGGALTSPTITGDTTISDGKLTWTDAAAEVAGAWTFSNTSTDAIDITANSATTSNILHVQTTSLTSGTGIRVDTDESALSAGLYFEAYDTNSAEIVWQVGENGVNTITGKSGDVLILTLGDLQITDGNIDIDEGKIEVDTVTDETTYVKRNKTGATSAAVEIECTHTGDTGSALLLDHNGTGNAKCLEITHDGDYAAIDISAGAARTGNVIQCTMANQLAQTALDITGACTGTNGEGIIHVDVTGVLAGDAIRVDSTGANAATASLFKGISTGKQAGATGGICGYFEDTGAATATSYTVYISSTNNEALHVATGQSLFAEKVSVAETTATTNASLNIMDITATCSGTAAGGFGSALNFINETATPGSYEDAGRISFNWLTATDASEDSYFLLELTTGGTQDTDVLRVDNDANIIIGGAAADTSATNGIVIPDGTAPSALMAGAVELWADDCGGIAGHDGLWMYSEAGGINSIECGAGTVQNYMYYADLADDATLTMPFSIASSAFGFVSVGNNEERSHFWIDNDGDVTVDSDASGNITSGADTDTKFCIGTAATQEPLVFKNRLGATKKVFLCIWYN